MWLEGKKVVLCRRSEQAREMVSLLQRRKAWPFVFPTFFLEPLDPGPRGWNYLEHLSDFQWLVFGSPNGVRFFDNLLARTGGLTSSSAGSKIGAVGRKTVLCWQKQFPDIPVTRQAGRLQELLEIIEETSSGNLRILNPTSQQSLENIAIQMPEHIEITRFPIYRAVRDTSHQQEEIEFVKSGNYDLIYFGSPSSFEFFRQLAGEKPLHRGVAICVSGRTTANYIQKAGFVTHVVPAKPEADEVVREMENYFSPASESVHPVSKNHMEGARIGKKSISK